MSDYATQQARDHGCDDDDDSETFESYESIIDEFQKSADIAFPYLYSGHMPRETHEREKVERAIKYLIRKGSRFAKALRAATEDMNDEQLERTEATLNQ